MKKIIALLLVLTLAFAFVACGEKKDAGNTESKATEKVDAPVESAVMSYDEFVAAELDDEVCVETYVQATQSWWDNKITVYTQDEDGAYFLYEMACSEEDAAKLVPGTKIVVTGYKAEWSGEVEIIDATFEFVDDGETFVAEPMDVTELLGTDELIEHQNKLASFTEMTVKAIEFKNGEPGDDIYVTLTKGDGEYSFCVERYLTDPETDVYKAVSELVAGDVINVEGFVYWYEGVNTHITAVEVVAKAETESSELEAWFEANKESFIASFEAAAGDSAESNVYVSGGTIVIDMNVTGINDATDEQKAEMQQMYDELTPTFKEMFASLAPAVPGLEAIQYNICEEDGDPLATILIEF